MKVRVIHRSKVRADGTMASRGWVWQCDEKCRWGGPFRTEGEAKTAARRFIEKETTRARPPTVG